MTLEKRMKTSKFIPSSTEEKFKKRSLGWMMGDDTKLLCLCLHVCSEMRRRLVPLLLSAGSQARCEKHCTNDSAVFFEGLQLYVR